jgi:hypothetical protein
VLQTGSTEAAKVEVPKFEGLALAAEDKRATALHNSVI